ncbi:TetR/AcrR family transcriptional regulator [Clostridium sp. KNHs216]|uniref:TetR/AcrR family transcriptional regulator n=1 Tax=Clostridium sp. KNHs216 TaxID=1550235 RepID=UPI00114DCAC6|nr:TetR/AcrR family transcriptional regulator [Clostridium sp. KNHs216]TQI67324.1 TetR family transcriptional regulator [Clostridium sp. KNHs216]
MSRSNIHYEEKRDELARQVFDIFMKNGYENTTLSLIVKELKISKGALYHYFTTKEQCADAAVVLCSKECYRKVACQIDDNMPAEVNFKSLILSCSALFQDNEKSMENINTSSNTIFHQKLMAALVKSLAPLYAKVITQGIHEKIFEAECPLETAQMILTLTNFYFDEDIFGWGPEEMPVKLKAFEGFLTNALKTKPGFFSFFNNFE